MPGNIYGVANPAAAAAVYGTPSGADVDLVAGNETGFILVGNLKAPSPGNWYPLIWLAATILEGMAASTALVLGAYIDSSPDFDDFTVEPGMLVASAEFVVSVPLVGPPSKTNWYPNGSTLVIAGLATANDSTVKGVGTRALVQLVRGPD